MTKAQKENLSKLRQASHRAFQGDQMWPEPAKVAVFQEAWPFWQFPKVLKMLSVLEDFWPFFHTWKNCCQPNVVGFEKFWPFFTKNWCRPNVAGVEKFWPFFQKNTSGHPGFFELFRFSFEFELFYFCSSSHKFRRARPS